MLFLLTIALSTANATPPAVTSGSDIQAWRTLGTEASVSELQDFLKTHQQSPLAELAVRRLEALGASIPTEHTTHILESVITHDARLARTPVSVAVATVKMETKSNTKSEDTTVASAE